MNKIQIHRHSCLVIKSEDFDEIGTEISFKIYLYDLQEIGARCSLPRTGVLFAGPISSRCIYHTVYI